MTEQPTTTATCKYPRCENPPEPASGPGRRPEYCADPGHNAMTAYRERKRLAGPERSMATGDADTDQPVTMARMTGAELLRQMRDLAGTLAATADRLTGAVATMTDPTAAEAEVEAARAAPSSGPPPPKQDGPKPSAAPPSPARCAPTPTTRPRK